MNVDSRTQLRQPRVQGSEVQTAIVRHGPNFAKQSARDSKQSKLSQKTSQNNSIVFDTDNSFLRPRPANVYTKAAGNIGKQNEMASFWSDLTKIAVCNNKLNVTGDRS